MSSAFLFVHIFSAVVGLSSGFLAMSLRKGSGWHGAAGSVFFISMLSMSASAVVLAAFWRPNALNVTVGLLTFYLVATGWRAARNRDAVTGRFDLAALLFALAVTAAGTAFGIEAARSSNGTKDDMPAAVYFIFASIALFCTVSDVRMVARGEFSGARRIARHLSRMSLALLIATVSFFPGQARLFPEWLRETNLLLIPHVVLIGSIAFWLYRVRARKRLRNDEPLVARQERTATSGVALRRRRRVDRLLLRQARRLT